MRQAEKTRRERWADWAGCLAAMGFCASLWTRASAMGLLLAPTLLHNLVIAASFLIRPPARAKRAALAPRIAAYGTTVLLPGYAALVPRWLPALWPLQRSAAFALPAVMLWMLGCLLGLWGAWHLRYSFSIEPQARQLVTGGPYRWARHPIYAAYLLQYAGILLLAPSAGLGLILGAWCLLAKVRIDFEENVLTAVFPEYVEYRRQAGMLGPQLFGHGTRRPAPATGTGLEASAPPALARRVS